MTSPWLDVPLADYEGHMALPEVAQARLIADICERTLTEYRPRSIAVLGCAGGSGFERISTGITERVVGVDLNPGYIQQARARFKERIPTLELHVGNIESEGVAFPPVELIFAGLVLEYVDVQVVLIRVRRLLTATGILCTVIQLPTPEAAVVTPSPFRSIQALAPFMRLIAPVQLAELAKKCGYQEIASRLVEHRLGKQFQMQAFRVMTPNCSVNTDAAPEATQRRLPGR